jgi:ribosomal protein S18 acetylase RimI-like enzyme
MFTNTIKKFIFITAITSIIGGSAYFYYNQTPQTLISDFNPARDTQEIMNIFHKNWYWLLASENSSPAFMVKHQTYDANPLHFGSLHFKVLREQHKLAGFAAYYMETPTQGRLLFLAVDHDFRGRGYGRLLAECAMQELFNLGADHLVLWTRVANLPAQKIYRELGFIEKFDENGFLCFEYYPQ